MVVLTDDVVCEVVLPHRLQQARSILCLTSDQTEHLESILFCSVLDAVLHHIAGNLLLGEHSKLVQAQADDPAPRFLTALSNDGLHDVVAPVVCNEFVGDLVELLKNERFVGLGSLLNHPLDHSAGILLLGKFGYPASDGVVDEIDAVPWKLGQDLLNNMVAVVALHDANDIRLNLLRELDLLFDENILQSLWSSLANSESIWMSDYLTSCTQRQPYSWVDNCTT